MLQDPVVNQKMYSLFCNFLISLYSKINFQLPMWKTDRNELYMGFIPGYSVVKSWKVR
jgi:hypothetical protein